MNPIEQARAEQRAPITVPVVLDDNTCFNMVRTIDASPTGLGIALDRPLVVGETVRLIPLCDGLSAITPLADFELVARVCWVREDVCRAVDSDQRFLAGLRLLSPEAIVDWAIAV